MSSRNTRKARLESIKASMRSSFVGKALPAINPGLKKNIKDLKCRNSAKLNMNRRRSIMDSLRKENSNMTQTIFFRKPKKFSLFNKKISMIPNFWNNKKEKKLTKDRNFNADKGKIIICRRQTEGERREQIKRIFESMDEKYSKYIRSEIQRKHKLAI